MNWILSNTEDTSKRTLILKFVLFCMKDFSSNWINLRGRRQAVHKIFVTLGKKNIWMCHSMILWLWFYDSLLIYYVKVIKYSHAFWSSSVKMILPFLVLDYLIKR